MRNPAAIDPRERMSDIGYQVTVGMGALPLKAQISGPFTNPMENRAVLTDRLQNVVKTIPISTIEVSRGGRHGCHRMCQ